jgi:hypothetical protein
MLMICVIVVLHLALAGGSGSELAWSKPAPAQRMKAGLLACDVSAGIGYIIHSRFIRLPMFGRSIYRHGRWSRLLAGDYVGASAEVSLAITFVSSPARS